MGNIYIHYGSDHYDPSLFIPIRNCDWKPKPADGTGLWASPEGRKVFHGNDYAGSVYEDGRVVYGWREWCEDNHFNVSQLKKLFRFQLKPDANVITLREPSDLMALSKTQPWQPKDKSRLMNLPKGEMPDIRQLEELYKPNPCFLDYEKIVADGVDAIELQNSYVFTDCLGTWDCDSIVIMNPGVIVPL